MCPDYSEMFSTLGYDALDVIFGIDSNSLSEEEKRDLVHLVGLLEKDEKVKNSVQDIFKENTDDVTKKNMLLALLSKKDMN